jgi:hypothetical protein
MVLLYLRREKDRELYNTGIDLRNKKIWNPEQTIGEIREAEKGGRVERYRGSELALERSPDCFEIGSVPKT